jgi:hypothetical protein
MMKAVDFDEEGHIYKRKDNGEWLQGVSTVSSIVPKDWLSAWGAKEAVKALGYSDYEDDTELAEEVMKKIGEMKHPKEFIALLKEAKGASRRKSKEALVDGTAGHVWLEDWVKASIRNTPVPELPKGNLERPLIQFLEWEDKNIDYWILSEARICNLEKGYAGTLDALAMMKSGKLAVIDFKFASHISEDYYLQTAGYQACFEAQGIKIDERIIIRLPKTLLSEEWDKKEQKYNKVENNIEVVSVPNNYEFDRDTFFHCLPVKQWINQMTKK